MNWASTLAESPRGLTDLQLRELFEQWQQYGDQRSRERLVDRFMPLARQMARRYLGANEPIDDLVQVASLGLVKAIDRFDPSLGWKFSSYAVPTILGELRRYFRDTGWSVHVPRGAQERALTVEKALKHLSATTPHEPTVSMIAEYLEWPHVDVLDALEARSGHHSASLDAPIGEADGETRMVIDTLGGDDDAYELIEDRLTAAEAMRHLPLRLRQVVRMRFEEDLTQGEIGERIGVSQMQVSRLLRAALDQLRELADAGPVS